MSDAFKFDPVETEMIARMFKERMTTRQIAKITGRPMSDIANYINMVLSKRVQQPKPEIKKPVIIGAERKSKERVGLRHYNDPLAAVEGSRKLLEAVNAYLQKRQEVHA
jgi:hypothetical protein